MKPIDFVIAFFGIASLWSVGMLFRNDAVFKFRGRMIKLAGERANEDIRNGMSWRKWYHAYNTVSYDEMFWKFWRKPSSFYDIEMFEGKKPFDWSLLSKETKFDLDD